MIKHDLAKKMILRATYEALVFDSEYETFDVEVIHKRVSDYFSAGYVRRVLNILAEDGLISVDQYDEYSSPHYTVSDTGIVEAESLQSTRNMAASVGRSDIEQVAVPASDRIVSSQDNSIALDEIREELDQLRSLVSKDNTIGDQLGDEKEIVQDELSHAVAVIEKPKFRLASLIGWLVPVLRFLSKRFAGSAVDEVAAKLVGLLEKLL